MSFYCIDSFSGAGGLSLGLSQAGFCIAYAFDFNETAVESYNSFFEEKHCEVKKVEDLTAQYIVKKTGIPLKALDLFAGGPPCQGFSRQHRGAHNGDDRNKLVIEYARLVNELQPKCFLLENVDMLGLARGEKYFQGALALLNNYEIYPHFYNSADYGVPQTRVRFITVGVRKDLNCKFIIPKPTVKTWETVGSALDGLPEPPADGSMHPTYQNHQRANVSKINIERFSHVPQGGGWKDIPFKLRLPCHQVVDTSKGGWPDVYGRLEWNGQCPTITGGFDSFSRGRFGHPFYDRPLTPREAARIQGFPDSFIFKGNRGEVRKQIGNAVPPPLAQSIGKSIIRMLKSIN